MEKRSYSAKEVELATRVLNLYATCCARFWIEKLSNPASFWSCKCDNKKALQMGQEHMQKKVPYIPITTQQVFDFINKYEKLAAKQIPTIVQNDSNIAIVLGHSDEEIFPGFTSGVKDKGEPEFFLRQVMKEAGISGIFSDMQEHRISIKNGRLYVDKRILIE